MPAALLHRGPGARGLGVPAAAGPAARRGKALHAHRVRRGGDCVRIPGTLRGAPLLLEVLSFCCGRIQYGAFRVLRCCCMCFGVVYPNIFESLWKEQQYAEH